MSPLVIFSPDVARLARFYELVLDAEPTVEASGDIRLFSARDEVLVHSIRGALADAVTASSSAPRANSALKPVFEVASLPTALGQVEPGGGVVTERTFQIDGTTRHDVVDPDGNVIQLRG
jgi:predicted enzyme related to lactoylglutathione lyase